MGRGLYVTQVWRSAHSHPAFLSSDHPHLFLVRLGQWPVLDLQSPTFFINNISKHHSLNLTDLDKVGLSGGSLGKRWRSWIINSQIRSGSCTELLALSMKDWSTHGMISPIEARLWIGAPAFKFIHMSLNPLSINIEELWSKNLRHEPDELHEPDEPRHYRSSLDLSLSSISLIALLLLLLFFYTINWLLLQKEVYRDRESPTSDAPLSDPSRYVLPHFFLVLSVVAAFNWSALDSRRAILSFYPNHWLISFSLPPKIT